MAVRFRSLADGDDVAFKWESSLDKILTAGNYAVEIEHYGADVGLPMEGCGTEHSIVGTLVVTDSGALENKQGYRVMGQVLTFTLRESKETSIYTRTYAGGEWGKWCSLARTGMYDEITNADELYSTVTTLAGATKELEKNLQASIINYNEWKGSNAELSLPNVLADDEFVKMVKSGTILTFKNTSTTWKRFQYTAESAAAADVRNYSNWKELSGATYSIKQAVDADKVQISTTGENGAVKDILNIVAATTEKAGVMSAADKAKLNNDVPYPQETGTIVTSADKKYIYRGSGDTDVVAGLYWQAWPKTVDLRVKKWGMSTNDEVGVLSMPAATSEKAGVMTAEDKIYLDNSPRGNDVPMLLRKNYYNPNDEDFVGGNYLDLNGNLNESSGYCVTGYIPLNSVIGQLICTRNGEVDTENGGAMGFYDENKQPLYYKQVAASKGLAVWEFKVAYVRFSVRFYSTGHIQIERGSEYTSKIGYGASVWDAVLPDGYVEPQSLSPVFGIEKSLNLLNPSEMQKDMAAYISNGEIKFTVAPTITASGFVEVKPLTTYTFWYSQQYFFLDADRKVIGDKISAIGTAIATTPENCRYLVINFYNTRSSMGLYNLDTTARVYEGDIIYPYIPYGISSDKMQTYLQQQSISSLGNDGVRITRETTAANTDFTTNTHNYPQSIKDNQISFYGEFDTFGTLTIGRGFTNNANAACRFEITTTNVTLSKYDGSGWAQQATVEHGLSMNTYVKVLVSEKKNKVLLFVQTLTGSFEHEFDYWSANGTIAFNSSTEVSNAMLCASNPMFKCPVWMFGDSYYGVDTPNRQRYWLRKWGYENVLVQSFGGQGSNDAYNDLLRCLDFGTPKYIVWSIGMNDDNGGVLSDFTTGVWYTTYLKLKKLCEAMDIELILTTIPEVRGNYFNKDAISEVVRNSGLRYIDMAKAVGSNTAGEWYGNGTEYDYQSSDDVHPTELGAKAMAMQILIDFPEIMQY